MALRATIAELDRFSDKETRAVYNGHPPKLANHRIPPDLQEAATTKIDFVLVARHLSDLEIPPSNRLEALKGQWAGYYSIRINQKYRVRFQWGDGQAFDVWVGDYHDLL